MPDCRRSIFVAARNPDDRGASAVEYGLLIAGIAALIVVILFAFGDNVRDIFDETCDTVNRGGSASCATD